jgi:hypothetical protein
VHAREAARLRSLPESEACHDLLMVAIDLGNFSFS